MCLQDVKQASNGHDWLATSDSNEIRMLHERVNHGQFNMVGATDFNEVVQGMMELALVGVSSLGPMATNLITHIQNLAMLLMAYVQRL